MPKISEHFKLVATQPRLDFVDTLTERDVLLFVDPFAISLKNDSWSTICLDHINSFFQTAISLISGGDTEAAKAILSNLKEPKETGLGYGVKPGRGRGVSGGKALDLYDSLSRSRAAKTGLLQDLGEFDLFVEGIGPDGLSDITTNILKRPLIEYTQRQCDLWGIPLRPEVAVSRIWDCNSLTWVTDYCALPVIGNGGLILVPKFSVRRQMTLNSQEFYSDFVLEYLEQEELSRGSSLVHVIKKSGERKVYKKDLQKKFAFSKDFLAKFAEATPAVLEKYKAFYRDLPGGIGAASNIEIMERFEENFDECAFAQALSSELATIERGSKAATLYHRFMIGVIEFLFYPALIYPVKEQEIHEGRKRIDITYTNSATSGFFFRAQTLSNIKSHFLPVECKNYSSDPANPELDQIAGRLSIKRGKLGILCCRQFESKERFLIRCVDTANDDRGLILPLDDADICDLLNLVVIGKRRLIDEFLDERVRVILG